MVSVTGNQPQGADGFPGDQRSAAASAAPIAAEIAAQIMPVLMLL